MEEASINIASQSNENENKIISGFDGTADYIVSETWERFDDAEIIDNGNFEGFKEEIENDVANQNTQGTKEENVSTVANQNFVGANEENVNNIVIDTAAPIESVKAAVSKFGGIVDWKERRKTVQFELEKAQIELPEMRQKSISTQKFKSETITELRNTKRLVEDLKLSLEKADTEEKQAKQDAELAELRMNEVKQGINDFESIAAKTQLEVAKERHLNAIQEFDSVKNELEVLKIEYEVLIKERDIAVKRAEVSVNESREIEKNLDEITLELINLKELIDSSRANHLEAEEQRINASLAWEKEKIELENEIQQEEAKLVELNAKVNENKELELKLEKASDLLVSLRAEFFTLMDGKLSEETDDKTEEVCKELTEVKNHLDKVKDEANCLRFAAASLKIDLDRERGVLGEVRERERAKALSVLSLETELNRLKRELELVKMRENEKGQNTNSLQEELKEGSDQSERAKSEVKVASEELRKIKEEIDQSKSEKNSIEIRNQAIVKETEATKASEELAKLSINSLNENEESENGVTLSIEEYNSLSKKAREEEHLANKRVVSAIDRIQEAKESELKTLEKLEETKKEIEERKIALKLALEKAERAREEKLEVEMELRKWRSKGEQRRKTGDSGPRGLAEITSLEGNVLSNHGGQVISGATRLPMSPRACVSRSETLNSKPDSKGRRRSFFPRIVMFLARKKVQTLKQ